MGLTLPARGDILLDMERYGQSIRAARKAAGLTQGALAALLGCQPSAVSHLERDRRTPSVPTLVALCGALGVSADTLLGLDAPQDAVPKARAAVALAREHLDRAAEALR